MNTTGWNSATAWAADRIKQETEKPAAWGFRNLRVHDLKHTFGHRCALLAYRWKRVPAAELGELIDAVEKMCDNGTSMPTLIKASAFLKVTQKSRTKEKPVSCLWHNRLII